jgi:hypothetical protein
MPHNAKVERRAVLFRAPARTPGWATRARALEILRRQPGVLGDASEHSGSDFLAIVKREDEVQPALAGKCAVRTRLALNLSTDPDKG